MSAEGIFHSNFAAQFAAANRVSHTLGFAENIMKSFAGLDRTTNYWAGIANAGNGPMGSVIDKVLQSMAISSSKIESASLHSFAASPGLLALHNRVQGLDVTSLTAFAKSPNWLKTAQGFDGLTTLAARAASIGLSKDLSSWLSTQAAFANDAQGVATGVTEAVARLGELSALQQNAFLGFSSRAQGIQGLPDNWATKNYNTQRAFDALYSQLFLNAERASKWADLSLGTALGEEVFSFSDELASEQHLTSEGLSELRELASRVFGLLVVLPVHKAAVLGKILLHLLGSVWNILDVHAAVTAMISHETETTALAPATERDIYCVEQEVSAYHQEATEVLADRKEAHTVLREVEIYLKPKGSSLITGRLSPNTIVVIINLSNEWAYIRFQDVDGEPAHGWARKKYLGKV